MTTEAEQKLMDMIGQVATTVNQVLVDLASQKAEMQAQREEIQAQRLQIKDMQEKLEVQCQQTDILRQQMELQRQQTDILRQQMELQRQEMQAQGERLSHIETKVGELDASIKKLTDENARFNDRLENYQKGSDKLFNLAVALIVSATVAVIAGMILTIVRGL